MFSMRKFTQNLNLQNLLKFSQLLRNHSNNPIFDVETSEDFEQKVKRSDRPVVVDFHASWCSPCKKLAPRIENIVTEKQGSLRLARVDIDEHSELAINYNVGSVPSLLVMQNGKVLNRLVGLQSTEYIREWVDNAMRNVYKLKDSK